MIELKDVYKVSDELLKQFREKFVELGVEGLESEEVECDWNEMIDSIILPLIPDDDDD